MRFLDSCPVCESNVIKTLFRPTFNGDANDAVAYFLSNRKQSVHGQVQKCLNCSFVFTNPQFTPEEYTKIYSSARQTSVVDANRVRYERLGKFVRLHAPVHSRLLDFGCGDGAFLDVMTDYDCTGFEVATRYETRCAGKIIFGDILDLIGQQQNLQQGTYNVVTAWDVIEHLADLGPIITALVSLLAPQGRLILTVPDISSWPAKIFQKKWNCILLEHLWYFNSNTLERFLTKHGLRKIRISSVCYPVTIDHLFRRVNQQFRIKLPLHTQIAQRVIPFPAGLMIGVFSR
jgi:2-polyprenyl-3-methyl-5-hydroxy-6-metoxy-1,4-benzoquinol methylase